MAPLQRLVFLASLLSFVATATSSARAQTAPRPRDVWYEYIQGNVRCGNQHVIVVKQADGNYRYAIDTIYLLDMFGAQKQRIQTHAVYVVTPTLQPVSIQIDSSDLTGKSQVSGKMSGDELLLNIHRAGEPREERIPWGKNANLVFSHCLEDRLAGLAPSIKTAKFREISGEGLSAADTTATRQESTGTATAKWRVDTGSELGVRTFQFDAHGVLESVATQFPDLLMRRCSEEQAKKIVYRKMDGRELLTFKLDKPIVAPNRLRKLEVRMTWKDIPLDELRLEDARQRITKSSQKDGTNTVILTIGTPAEAASKMVIPIDDKLLTPYLAETAFVKPKHPKIQAAAIAAIKGEKNAELAVRALSKWVNGYIEGELSARTLTGPEVLACKSGKCTEYSTLFASMARSVGIPTRLALGERMVAGRWMGHMWNEAYVGRWITVDATVNEVDSSFALLKFVHSDTVMGTQTVRWKLTRSLTLSIESFELTPTGLEGKYKTGIADGVYTSIDRACRIKAPDKDWTLVDQSEGAVVTVQFKPKAADGVMIHFVAFPLPAGTPGKLILENRLKMWKGNYNKFETTKSEAWKIWDVAGHATRFGGMTKTKRPMKNVHSETVWGHGGHGYLLTMFSREAIHDRHLPDYEKLLASFEFLGQ